MNQIDVKWRKGDSVVTQQQYVCDTDQAFMRYVGSAPCIHQDGYAYIFQCEKCMRIDIVDYLPHNMQEDFSKYGWQRIEDTKSSN